MKIDVANARREAREALKRARPEIERALAQVKSGALQVKASEEAIHAVKEAQPEIDEALRNVGPTVDRALAEAREDLRKYHLDINVEKKIDDALRRAQIKIETRNSGEDNPAADNSDETASENN